MASRAYHLRPRALTLAISLAFTAGGVAAQEAATPARLSDVVVSASGFEQDIREAPASISVITREDLEQKQFRDLAEALQDVEGIDVRGGTGKTGGLSINMRGMPSEYTLILIDGRRQNPGGDVTPNGFGDALTSFMPPVSAIERIEIIRGPMSTLYGSDAMGGVVNIITRRVAKEWGGSFGIQTGVPLNKEDGDSQRLNVYVDGPLVEDRLGIALRGDIYRRAESDLITLPDGSEIGGRNPALPQTRQHTLGARLSLTPNNTHDIWLDFEQGRTWYNNDDGRLGSRDAEADPSDTFIPGYADYMRLNRDQVAIGHTSRLEFGTLESSLMRNTTETLGRTIPRPESKEDEDTGVITPGETYEGTRDPAGANRTLETTSLVFDTKLVAPIGESHLTTVGAQWMRSDLEDSFLPRDYKRRSWAVFVEDEWQLTDSLIATFGGRYDHHDAFGGEFSPRAYLVWNTSDHWTLKGGVSKGFKAPDVRALIPGGSNVSGQGRSLSIGNPDLKPETSRSTEIAAIYDNLAGFSVSATAFHNKIEDKISDSGECGDVWIPSCAANPTARYDINLDEAKTWGLELASRIQFAPRWSLNMNYTWTDSKVTQAGKRDTKLSDTAKHMANATLRWDATEKASYWVRGEYRGKSRRFDSHPDDLTVSNLAAYQALGDELKAYTLFHVGGSYKVTPDVTLSANINNVFDKDFRKYSSYTDADGNQVWGSPYFQGGRSIRGTTPSGRTLWLSANVTF